MIGFNETTLDQLTVDHQVEVNTLTGMARLSVPIRISSGRESFGPDLALGYASGERNSTFGVGWFLSGVPSIGCDTSRGLPTYREGDERYAYAGGQELAPYRRKQSGEWLPVVDDRGNYRVQRFRSKVERSFERFEKWTHRTTHREHWIVYARNGVVSIFGNAADNSTRIADPADPDHRTFQWLLESQYHPKGNAILYEYKTEDVAGLDATLSYESRRLRAGNGFAQRYLKRILYGNSTPLSHVAPANPANQWCFEVVFDYGEHSAGAIPTPSDAPPAPAWTVRQDPFSTHRPGFEIRTYRLCRRILIFHRFPELGAAPCLVGATELTHRQDPAGSSLEQITYRGYRTDLAAGTTVDRAVPSLKMTYSDAQPAHAFDAPEAAENVPAGLDGAVYQWIDLQNEGLPGILSAQGGGWYFKENLGGGRFGPAEVATEIPCAVSAAFHLQDFNGNGHLNFVGFEGREAGSYEHDRNSGRWEGFRTFRDLPRVDFANARVQWIDLNGDGHADLLVDHQDRLAWYPSEGSDGFSSPTEIAKPDIRNGGAPTLTQDNRLQTFFADMTGDGLLDMVQVGNGRVEYWPHVGHGQFGPGVTMENAPFIEGFCELDPRRLRFVDLDGSGTADLLYLGKGEIRFWINQSGNRFGAENRLKNLPFIDCLSSAHVFDFLGDGSNCLVWSTPLPLREGQAIQYLRLDDRLPPRLLTSVSNGAGRETKLSYRSSAFDYLRDKNSDRPWRTLLPRHSMVVDQIEGIDHIGGGRLITRYEYHDGYFDDEERRFVGFGLVDALDTDQLSATGTTPAEAITPPSLVRNWYHTGACNGFSRRAIDFYARDPLAVRPPEPALEGIADLTTEEQLDACRALAGVQWRQEFFAVRPDGTRALHPLRTAEFAYRVSRLQPLLTERDAVFSFVQSESIRYEYEEDPTDPRVMHDILVASDPYGNVRQRATVAYPRRNVGSGVRPEQQILHAELTSTSYRHFDSADRFEVGIEIDQQRYSLTGLSLGSNVIFARQALIDQVTAALASTLGFHDVPSGATPQARLIQSWRNLFWDAGISAALPLGEVGPVTLLHHVERAVLPEAAVDTFYGGRVTSAMLSGEGSYRRDIGLWWADDTIYRYRDSASFFRLDAELTPGGGRQTYTFDPHFIFVTAIEDLFGNRVESTFDYQVMASAQIKDANDNLSEVLYDPLGVATVTVLYGQLLGSDGNPHPVGSDPLAAYVPRAAITAAGILANPANFLQNASRFLFHDIGAFGRGEGPPRSILLEREQHVHDGEGSTPSPRRIRVTVSYVDGFGRPIQIKLRADPGPAIKRDGGGAVVIDGDGQPVLADAAERWLTSGHEVYNNKGWIVRKYEPLFSTSPAFETDEALRRYGVSSRTHYDPVGRAVRQEFPNGTFITTNFTAWETRSSDANDNVIGSAYEAQRHALPASDPERLALTQAQAHAKTPTIAELDVLGRPYRVRELGQAGIERISTTIFGVLGLPDRVVDPRGLTAFTYRYDMLGRLLHEHSVDAGDLWTLLDAGDRTIHRWDGRDLHTEHRYDQNGRPTETRVDGALGLDNLVERIVYGDNPVVAQAKLRNLRGRVLEHYDDAGVLAVDRYYMDGQAIDVHRTLRADHKTTVNWSNPATVVLDSTSHSSRVRLDGLSRISSQTLPDGTIREYDYAALGHVSEVRVTTADGHFNRKVITSALETNARGQRTRMRLGNGVETNYEYDPLTFRLERLYNHGVVGAPRDYLDVEYTYDPVGNITRWIDRVQDPGAATPLIQGLTVSSACTFAYDAHYQLKTATGRVHQALLEHDFVSGTAGANPIKGTRHLGLNNGAAIERYTRSYDYDLSGNIQRIRHQGVTRNWTTEIWTSPNSNRSLPKKDLSGVDIVNPESRFDQNGNTIYLPHLRSMEWNYNNRLARGVIIDRSATGDPNDAEYYVYGADGLRIRRVTERLVAGQVEVTETIYFEDCEIRRISRGGSIRLLRQTSHITDGSARLATLHQWSIDQAALETDDIANKKLHYLVGNHLGSISLELDDAGDVITYEEYFPFGGTSFMAGNSARDVKLKEYRYSGKLRDDTTGFYCYEYRYYAPFIGNWLSPDPLGPVDGLNLYRFVHNNPIRFVDADGLLTEGQVLATGPSDLTEAQAINYFNWHYAFERRERITDLSRNKEGNWVRESVRPLTETEIRTILELSERLKELKEELKPEEFYLSPEDLLAEITRQDDAALQEGAESGGNERSEETGAPGADGGHDRGTAQPADGSSGNGTKQQGQNGESGNGGGTARKETGAGQDGQASKGGGQGSGTGAESSERKGKGTGPGGGETRGRAGGQEGGGAGTGSRRSSGTAPDGATDVPPVPPGLPIGPDGIPYSPDLQLPEVMPESGTPVTDPSQILFGAGGGDVRSEPASESGSQIRPGDARTDGQGEQSQQRSDDPESLAERLTRYAGYWHLEFGNEQGEGAASGGIPGAFGSINAGAWGQGFFLALTVVDIVLTIISLGELPAVKAAVKNALVPSRQALRRLASTAARVFTREFWELAGTRVLRGAVGLRNLLFNRGRAFRTFVGDTGLFAERLQPGARAIADQVLRDAANHVIVPQAVLRELSQGKLSTKLRQWARLLTSRTRISLVPDPTPASILSKGKFGVNDFLIVTAAAERNLAVVTANPKMVNQITGFPALSAALGHVPIHSIGKEILSALDLAKLIP